MDEEFNRCIRLGMSAKSEGLARFFSTSSTIAAISPHVGNGQFLKGHGVTFRAVRIHMLLTKRPIGRILIPYLKEPSF